MTDMGRRYHVGITSVLRRCLIVLPAVGLISTQSVAAVAQGAPSAATFVRALDQCLSFYETEEVEVFSGWVFSRPYERVCDNCNSLLGYANDPESKFVITIERSDGGENIGVACSTLWSPGPTWNDQSVASIDTWLTENLEAGRLHLIPEALRRTSSQVAVACAAEKSAFVIELMPGMPGIAFEAGRRYKIQGLTEFCGSVLRGR